MSDMVSMSSTMRCDLEKPARLKVAYSFRIHKPTRPTYLPEKSEDPKWDATSLCPLLKVRIVLNIIKDNNAMAV